MSGRADAQIVSHAFQPLKEIEMQHADATDKRQNEKGNEQRRAFGALELHAEGLNKKPAQLKAALVLKQNKITGKED